MSFPNPVRLAAETSTLMPPAILASGGLPSRKEALLPITPLHSPAQHAEDADAHPLSLSMEDSQGVARRVFKEAKGFRLEDGHLSSPRSALPPAPDSRAVVLWDPEQPAWEGNTNSCLIFSLDDGTIRTLSLSKAACYTPVTGKPSDGSKQGVKHIYYRSQFAIWSVQVSPVTGLAAYCCADGSTLCFQLTARTVDKEKNRRHGMPHFLCGALMEIENSLTIETPLPYISVAELPRPLRGLPPHSNNVLAEEPQVQDDDPAENSGYRDHESSARRKKKKSGTSRSDKLLNETRRVNTSCAVREENQDLKTVVTQSNENFLVFPPKIVAMHRVRWNTNKGSERWLCYGGAAGIIRCQKIGLPTDL